MDTVNISEFGAATCLNAEKTLFEMEFNHPDHGWFRSIINLDNESQDVNGLAFTVNDGDVLSASARSDRDKLLQKTDWWAMSDRTMTAEQTAYRQALRDISTHANWPNLADSDWPTKPE